MKQLKLHIHPSRRRQSRSEARTKAEIQRCIVHQIRNSLKFVSWKDRKSLAKDLKCVYSANTEEERLKALEEFNDIWGKKYSNIYQSWKNN